jgi:integrase
MPVAVVGGGEFVARAEVHVLGLVVRGPYARHTAQGGDHRASMERRAAARAPATRLRERLAGQGGKRVTHVPRSGKARRVAISAELAGRLEAYYREAVVEGGAPEDGYVWPGTNGHPLGRKIPNTYLERVLVRAKLTTPGEKKPRPIVTFHGLRHTAGLRLATRSCGARPGVSEPKAGTDNVLLA